MSVYAWCQVTNQATGVGMAATGVSNKIAGPVGIAWSVGCDLYGDPAGGSPGSGW